MDSAPGSALAPVAGGDGDFSFIEMLAKGPNKAAENWADTPDSLGGRGEYLTLSVLTASPQLRHGAGRACV